MSDPVDPEVLDRAVEEGRESVRTGMHVNTTQGYQEQEFRAIAAAAYRQGREDGIDEMTEATKEAMGEEGESRKDLEARIEELAARWEADGMSGYITKPLRSLLTDKEGEQ